MLGRTTGPLPSRRTPKMVKVNIKWGKEKFQDVELDTSGSVEAFKKQLCSMTGEPARYHRFPGTLAPCRTNHTLSTPADC